MKFYLVYKNNGLYDPVLDDQEPIYYEPGDLDPQSQPTEVPFKIQQFLEPEDFGSNIINFDTNGEPVGQEFDPSVILIEPRSLTASPFVNPSKPYRPFSTEPIPQIPDLEDPIILNPEYKDQFGKGLDDINPDYLLNVIPNGSNRFKLPISEQYDPEGTKKVKNTEIDSVLLKYLKTEKLSTEIQVINDTVSKKRNEEVKAEHTILKNINETVNNVEITTDNVKSHEMIAEQQENVKVVEGIQIENEIIKKELSYNEQMKKDIDITEIQNTAIAVVEDSLERAIAVTEEIKKEIEEESATEFVSKTENNIAESETKVYSTKQIIKEENSKEYVKKIEEKQLKEVKEDLSKEEYMNNENKTIKKEITTNIQSEIATNDVTNVNRKADEIIAKEDKSFSQVVHSENKSDIKSTKHVTDAKTEASDAKKRTYTIGLQTIPNIRGVVHSSYHYDLLLRTFFIHLTDVMVALSRFVLTQPVFNTETQENISKTEIYQESSRNVKTSQEEVFNTINKVENEIVNKSNKQSELQLKENVESLKKVAEPVVNKKKDKIVQTVEQNISVNENTIKTRELVTPVAFTENITEHNIQTLQKQNLEETAVTVEKKVKSGSEMAQRTERKLTKDVTQKMDCVISEFQTIAVEDKKEMFQRNRRSRSRSQIEEEVAKESDPLEWLSKVDSQTASQEISKERTSYKKESSSVEKTDKKHYEKHEIKHKKYKPPKQMYLAVVEAHVYTNKDVIFEDAAEFSETSSVQSAEETNIALESLETMSIENVAIENAIQQIEHAKIIEDTKELAEVSTQSAAVVANIKETVIENHSSVQKELKQEIASEATDFKQEIVQQSQNVIEQLVETKELVSKKDESLSISKSSEITKQQTQELKAVEIKNESTTIDKNLLQSALIEQVIESKHVEIETKEVDAKPEVQIEEVTENVIVKSQKEDITVGEEYASLKIRKEVETEIESTNEIIEIEEVYDVSQNINEESVINKIELSKAVILDETEKVTEISVANTEYGLKNSKTTNTIMNLETDVTISKETNLNNLKSETLISNASSLIQESSFTAQSTDKKLTLQTDLHTQTSVDSVSTTIDTPTPSTVPPTPLTDEYVFKLSIPLPKSTTPIPRDSTLSPEEEDPQIVKKKLIPHIETSIEKVVYDPPLPTPPGDRVQSPLYKIPGLFGGSNKFKPVYRKPGLFGGADNPDYRKEEIREIERKSSLLASAIDETIKSIEEYKEEVGIEKKKEVKIKKEERTEIKEVKTSNSFQEISMQNTIMESQHNGFIENNKISDGIVQNGVNSINAVNSNSSKNIEENEINNIVDSTTKRFENNSSEANETKNIERTEALEKQKKENFDIKSEIIVQNGINNENTTVIDEKLSNTLKKMDDKVVIKENGYAETDYNEINNNAVSKMDEIRVSDKEERRDPMLGFRSVVFEPEAVPKLPKPDVPKQGPVIHEGRQSPYVTDSGDVIGTIHGIVDGLEEPVLDADIAKELGKPGISEQKIAELISGEAEMLREAHVMGLARVLNSHMHRTDDSSVDFQTIKPMIGSLKDSEVIKVLNEELARQREEQKKKEDKKWTTFLQKPKRPVPKVKFGYHGWTAAEQALVEEPYKVKIVKQAKPKVAPDYKPEDFETGPLPWEERAEIEASLPPVEPEEPILIPEVPEFLEAVDPLKESEVPDLEDTGIPLPPPKEPTPDPEESVQEEILTPEEAEEEVQKIEEIQQEKEEINMENNLAEQLVKNVQSMVDPNASLEQQLLQMRAQLSALAQLPEVIQQTLELVSKQLNKITQQEITVTAEKETQEIEVNQNQQNGVLQNGDAFQNDVENENGMEEVGIQLVEDNLETGEPQIVQDRRVLQTPVMTDDIKIEKMKKEQEYKNKLDSEARQIKQRPTPRVGKPNRMFGPLDPDSRPVVLPGGRRWRKTEDVYNEQLIAETLQAQSELLQGKTMGFESDLLPYDKRINFMKYEKPPVSLDHLAQSETYKLVHGMDQTPLKRVELLTPVIAEADYRERCRSMTPSGMKHMQIPQQFHP